MAKSSLTSDQARSLVAVRREAARRQDERLAEIAQDVPVEGDDDTHLMWLDSRKLRGLPCFAKGASGVVTDSFVPGSDEHLERMDAA